MWTNITGWVTVIGVNLTVVSVITGYLMNRMSHFEDELAQKTDSELCAQKYHELESDMKRGETAFTEIREELKAQGKLLAQVDTTVRMILANMPERRRDS